MADRRKAAKIFVKMPEETNQKAGRGNRVLLVKEKASVLEYLRKEIRKKAEAMYKIEEINLKVQWENHLSKKKLHQERECGDMGNQCFSKNQLEFLTDLCAEMLKDEQKQQVLHK